jgi:uncharacterized damage-inducible protein DinB
MIHLAGDLTRLFVRELETVQRELALFPDDDSVWRTLPGISNSAGNLALHLAGNLLHYVGAMLGGTGYVRNRPLEFSRPSGTRAELDAEVQIAIDVVKRVLPHVSDERMARDFPETIAGVTLRTGLFLMHLSAHAAFHVGQIGYLRRALTGDGRTSNAGSVLALKSDMFSP